MATHLIEPVSSEYEIEYPDVPDEFEVHAELYSRLSRAGINVRGEVKARGCFGLRKAKTGCRFDLVVFKDKKAVMILEVKGSKTKHKSDMESTRQGSRYPRFGVPVLVVYGFDGIDEACTIVGAAFR